MLSGDLLMIIHSHQTLMASPRRHARRAMSHVVSTVGLCALLGIVLLATDVRGDDAQSKPAAERPRVPMVSTEGPPRRIEGKIMRSSRGKKGPVRLLVERKDGEPVTVLVAPEDVCDRLGLSLKADEQVVVEGTMLKSDRPILVATSFVVDGKTIRVRDADGKILDPAVSAGATRGGSSGSAATVTGAKQPEASPKP